MAIVNDGIRAPEQTHLKGLTRNERNEHLTEVRRQLFYPYCKAPAGVQLTQECQDFVDFHRTGFNIMVSNLCHIIQYTHRSSSKFCWQDDRRQHQALFEQDSHMVHHLCQSK